LANRRARVGAQELVSALTPFDVALAGMIAQGIPREKAAAALRANPAFAPAIAETRTDERRDLVLEKAEQLEVVKRFRVCGFAVYNLSQYRPSKVTPGIPDLWLMNPARRVGLFWECKRQVGGRFSPAQIEFATGCRDAGVLYGSGDRYDAERWLVEHRLAEIIDGSLFPRKETHNA